MDDTFRTQWTITPHLPDESSALVDETHRRTHTIPAPLFIVHNSENRIGIKD